MLWITRIAARWNGTSTIGGYWTIQAGADARSATPISAYVSGGTFRARSNTLDSASLTRTLALIPGGTFPPRETGALSLRGVPTRWHDPLRVPRRVPTEARTRA